MLDPSSDAFGASITSLTLDAADWGPTTRIGLTLSPLTEVSQLTIVVRVRRDFGPIIGQDAQIRSMSALEHLTIRCPAGGLRVPEPLVCAVVCGVPALPLVSLTLEGVAVGPDEPESGSDEESGDEAERLTDYADSVQVDMPVPCERTGLEEFVARAGKAASGVRAVLY